MEQFLTQVGWWFIPLMLILGLWSVIWKGVALWKSARNGQKAWFVVMLIVNTVGILEILYIFVFGKKESIKNQLDI